ncbi:hypothetical protein CBR_g48920 [Chara braunii]|uniref:Uncharacterized protein n=1 Tax=Chara braunii TaxID=69332 RepID=A0A388M3Z7_CHABU|nr:hypothetical protein CBR_g48920 [Chara braunii]|eukprot:GBG89212.1 hypothetical protein CBR_g48920 [Chara braunii]
MAKMSGSQVLAAFLLVSFILPALGEISSASPAPPSSSSAGPVSSSEGTQPSGSLPVPSSTPPAPSSQTGPVSPTVVPSSGSGSSPPVEPVSSSSSRGPTVVPSSGSGSSPPVEPVSSSSSPPPPPPSSQAAKDCSNATIKVQYDICMKGANSTAGNSTASTCTPECKKALLQVKGCPGEQVSKMNSICSAASSISASLVIAAVFAVLATSLVNRLD